MPPARVHSEQLHSEHVARIAAATRRRVTVGGARAAHASFWQDQLDVARGVPVAGDRCGDGAYLLIPNEQQERWRATVALHSDGIEIWLGMTQFLGAVRGHRPTRVHVRIDQRRERPRRLDGRIQVQAQLARETQVGPKAGGADNLVDGSDDVTVVGSQQQAIGRAADLGDARMDWRRTVPLSRSWRVLSDSKPCSSSSRFAKHELLRMPCV